MKPQTRRKMLGAEAKKPKHKPKSEAAPLFQRPQPSPAQMAAFNREINTAHQAIKATHRLRFNTPQDWNAWQEAVRQKYELYQKYMTLFAQHFSREVIPEEVARYDWYFWRDIVLLRGGDSACLETAVAFLEADPWFHGSGYAKEDIIPAINRLDLSPQLAARLQSVILNMVDRRHGREFRAYCRLAHKVDAPELREQLTRRLTHDDPNVRRRARWVLEALERGTPKEAATHE